ncbi:MAG: hypothetical protein CMN44_05735 [SAR116 cluster bacterium]|nr:hypothetical protein [SAR116 cluster bacterium]RPH09884.1 MAG: DMT family transporter [Alphaproteobacteria bacterium TMED54]
MKNNVSLGISLMILAIFLLSIMDGISKYLSQHYSVIAINMFRYWFFGALLIFLSFSPKEKKIKLPETKYKYIQILRGTILAIEMCFAHYCFLKIGLIEAHAIFASGPLIVAIFSLIILNEKFGWRRWLAIIVGFIGILIILRPGLKVFDPISLIAVGCAIAFSLYQVLTRYVSDQDDSNTSFFYTGVTGLIVLTLIGPFFVTEIVFKDIFFIIAVCCLGAAGHYLMIKSFQNAEASILQPFVYLHLVFVSFIGIFIFDENIDSYILIGSIIVIGAGLYTFWRERIVEEKIR